MPLHIKVYLLVTSENIFYNICLYINHFESIKIKLQIATVLAVNAAGAPLKLNHILMLYVFFHQKHVFGLSFFLQPAQKFCTFPTWVCCVALFAPLHNVIFTHTPTCTHTNTYTHIKRKKCLRPFTTSTFHKFRLANECVSRF